LLYFKLYYLYFFLIVKKLNLSTNYHLSLIFIYLTKQLHLPKPVLNQILLDFKFFINL
jgi:hypothetical protein